MDFVKEKRAEKLASSSKSGRGLPRRAAPPGRADRKSSNGQSQKPPLCSGRALDGVCGNGERGTISQSDECNPRRRANWGQADQLRRAQADGVTELPFGSELFREIVRVRVQQREHRPAGSGDENDVANLQGGTRFRSRLDIQIRR